MESVNIHEAKTQLSRLLVRVEAGEQIVIARSGRPVAVLTRYPVAREGLRILGRDEGIIEIPEDFDDPLPEDILRGFFE